MERNCPRGHTDPWSISSQYWQHIAQLLHESEIPPRFDSKSGWGGELRSEARTCLSRNYHESHSRWPAGNSLEGCPEPAIRLAGAASSRSIQQSTDSTLRSSLVLGRRESPDVVVDSQKVGGVGEIESLSIAAEGEDRRALSSLAASHHQHVEVVLDVIRRGGVPR